MAESMTREARESGSASGWLAVLVTLGAYAPLSIVDVVDLVDVVDVVDKVHHW